MFQENMRQKKNFTKCHIRKEREDYYDTNYIWWRKRPKRRYIDCCHIIIDDHGIKQQKVIRTETLYELLEKTKEHKKKELFLGRVPRGYLATKQRIEDFPKIQSKTAIFLEEDVRRIIYENSVYEIPIPNLMMIHSVTTNGCVSTDLFVWKRYGQKTAAKLWRKIVCQTYINGICKCQWCRRSLLWIKQYPKDWKIKWSGHSSDSVFW